MLAGCFAGAAWACGPYFPNRLLVGGDDPLLVAPIVDFRAEIRRIGELKADWKARPATDGREQQSAEVEAADLREALRLLGTLETEATRLVARHSAERAKAIARFAGVPETTSGTETSAAPVVVEGLPGEFADYFRGWLAWKDGRTNDAIVAWEAVLARPGAERRFKSVWAAYQLGRAKVASDPLGALADLQLARVLADQGFSDNLGLAAASLGWEGRALLNARRFPDAIDRYLAQLASGDDSALVSLRWAAAEALKHGGEPLEAVARNPRTRNVVNAYLLSSRRQSWREDGFVANEETSRWLEAAERTGTEDLSCAEPLALAAYQNGDIATARRWIDRAGPDAPVADWLRAKLLLRDGEVAEAARILARLTDRFPKAPALTNALPSTRFADTLRIRTEIWSDLPTGHQLLGELGVLRLTRGDYVEALDCLLQAGFWSDAAYVAERVLTVAELKNYLDSDWPAANPRTIARLAHPPTHSTEAEQRALDEARSREQTRTQIRDLLARRLTRLDRGDEAKAYCPTNVLPALEDYLAQRRLADDPALPASAQAEALWRAAQTLHTHGLALIGTESDPDWADYGASFDFGRSQDLRRPTGKTAATGPSSDELERLQASAAKPDRRYHYRFRAAELAWEASKRMPNHTDPTATVLHTAGSWIKYLDPQAADRFYKALVNRCRKTELGRVADVNRWFPRLDEHGKPIERPIKVPQPSEPPEADQN